MVRPGDARAAVQPVLGHDDCANTALSTNKRTGT